MALVVAVATTFLSHRWRLGSARLGSGNGNSADSNSPAVAAAAGLAGSLLIPDCEPARKRECTLDSQSTAGKNLLVVCELLL